MFLYTLKEKEKQAAREGMGENIILMQEAWRKKKQIEAVG